VSEFIESSIYLLPCPFCAATEIKFSKHENDACQSWLEVGCEQCGALFNAAQMRNELPASVLVRLSEKWNVRARVQRNSRDAAVRALRDFAAQNKLTIQITYTDRGRFHAELLTTTDSFDAADAAQLLSNRFVGSIFGQSPTCLVTDDDIKPKAEYDLACKIFKKIMRIGMFPGAEKPNTHELERLS
jgi:hypothetical protein